MSSFNKHIAKAAIKTTRRNNKLTARANSARPKTPIEYLRKGATIRTLNEDGTHEDKTYFDPNNPKYPSINAAKRASRELPMGSLKVVTKFPRE